LSWFNDIFEWAAYFLAHYDEYLLSDFFIIFVWTDYVAFWQGVLDFDYGNFIGNVINFFWNVFVVLFWFGVYLFFWPITFPLTAAFGPFVIFVLFWIFLLFGFGF
jgi:hypothetical protein